MALLTFIIMQTKYLFFISLLTFFDACQIHKPTKNKILLNDSIVAERVIKYKEYKLVKSRKEDFLENIAQVMGLPAIRSSSGEYLQIWLWGGNEKYVVNILGNNDSQQSSIYSFNSRITDTGEIIIIHKTWTIYQPKNGWGEVNKLIAENEILNLSDGRTVEQIKTNIPTHASWVQFELFHNNKYRYYEYFEPAYYRKVDLNSKYVYTFLRRLTKELVVEFYASSDTFVLEPIEK
jgi:hypothetical protein